MSETQIKTLISLTMKKRVLGRWFTQKIKERNHKTIPLDKININILT